MPSSTPSPAKRRKLAHPKGLFRTGRSVWNSTDDWDELVATSSLSTSSVSTRPPRPRALPSLAKSAEDVAVRHFRMLWADGKSSEPAELDPEDERGGKRKKTGKGTARERKERNERQEENQKGWWELQWPHVPDHLKARVTDGIMRMHGGWLSLDVIRKLFLFPPEYHLPGHLLPTLSSSKTIPAAGIRTIPLHPHPAYAKQMHTLKIQHCGQYSDAAVADMIKSMPKLQSVNLKGCSLVGERCVEEICKLVHVRRLNLKGTKVTEGDVSVILEQMGDVLEVFKIDDVAFRNPDSVFTTTYPRLTHLCLPGNIINGPRTSISAHEKSRMYASMVSAPVARPTPPDATFVWSAFGRMFPALTHLYLPGLLIPAADRIRLASDNTLVKLSLGTGGPAVPASMLCDLLASHGKSLVKLHLGHVEPTPIRQGPWTALVFGKVLSDLRVLEELRMIRDPNSRVSAACDGLMREAEVWLQGSMGQWTRQLKHLHLDLGHALDAAIFCHSIAQPGSYPTQTGPLARPTAILETLYLPNTPLSGFIPDWADIPEFAQRGANNQTRTGPAEDDTGAGLSPYWALCLFPMLRSLDLSNTDITTEQVFDVLDACPLLSRVDLTSCRGVDVRLRRRIFAGWKDARAQAT